MRGKVYLDGVVVAPHEARVSVFDRGFLYGDSVFETVRLYQGRPFAWNLHRERLYTSAQQILLTLPWQPPQLDAAVGRTIDAAGLADAVLRVVVTRGQSAFGLDPTAAHTPKLIIAVTELPAIPAETYTTGRHGAVVSLVRSSEHMAAPSAKTGNYLTQILAVAEARQRGADEAILLHPDGSVAEASSANIFARVDGVWHTPSLSGAILPGITRATLLRLCEQNHVEVRQETLGLAALRRATEIFVCSSVREMVPITTLDGAPVGDGRVGAATQHLHQLYRTCVQSAAGAGDAVANQAPEQSKISPL